MYVDWIDNKIEEYGEVVLKNTFTVTKDDLSDSDVNTKETMREFVVGNLSGDYYEILDSVLDIKHNLKLHKDLKISSTMFIGEENVSIFKKIDSLIKEPIIVGGRLPNAISEIEFENIVNNFPSRTEINHYADSRITNILIQYFDSTKDSGDKLAKLLNKKKTIQAPSFVKDFYMYEIEKFKFILEKLKDMLVHAESFSEDEWQKQTVEIILLLYPKYVSVLQKVKIPDYYSDPNSTTNRFIDLAMIDANGNIDLIEIKKPFAECILSTSEYRDNYTPKRELSGAIMQNEKYIFHLNKWGAKGECELTNRYQKEIPTGIRIQVSTPKSMILLGRSKDFNEKQRLDFEIIRRKYANVIDIITYDDLINRLENVINTFTKRK